MIRRLIISLLLPLFLAVAALPADKKMTLHHLNTASGFSNNFVTALHKDKRGLLWIGTSSGLYRYDGYSAKRIVDLSLNITPSLTNYIYDIQEDSMGRLWLHTDSDYGIYDPLTENGMVSVEEYLKPNGVSGYVSAALADEAGNIWLAVEGTGVYRLKLPGGELEKVNGDNIGNAAVTDLVQMGDKLIGITDDSMILSIDCSSLMLKMIEKIPDLFDDKAVNYVLHLDNAKRLWVISNENLRLYEPLSKRWLTDSLPDKGGSGVVKKLYNDNHGNLWIARDHHGIERVQNRNGKLAYVPADFGGDFNPDNTVTCFLEDEDGTIWFGTYKLGLYFYNESVDKFGIEQFPDVNCIAPAPDGVIWVGTDNSGLWQWNFKTGERKRVADPTEGDTPAAITSIAVSDDNTIYVGAFSRGLRKYKDGVFSSLLTGSELDRSYPWSMAFDKEGHLWIGTLGGGVFHYNPTNGDIIAYNEGDGLISNFVISLIGSRDGKMYIGSAGGVNSYNPGDGRLSRVNVSAADKNEEAKVVQLYEDSRGLLWMAFSSGLRVLDRMRGVVHDVPTSNSSYVSSILGITEDNGGAMWVSDGGRLVNLKVNFDDNTGAFSTTRRIYDNRDGLQNGDFNQRSFAKLPDGDIAVGGLFGINRFTPSEICLNTARPKVFFTDLYMGNSRVNVGEEIDGRVVMKRGLLSGEGIEFNHNPKDFTVYFASDNYALPEKTRFEYKLSGYSDEWVECPEGINHVTYTNLSPGSYRLIVKAVNGDGYESEIPAELPIKVHSSFWGSICAWLIYLVAFAGIVWGIVKIVRESERRHFERKRQEEEIRKQEELNQMKFRFFTNVSHDLRTPLTLIVSPLEDMIKESTDERQTKRLSLMRNNAIKLLSLVNQLLDFRKNEVAGLQLNPSEGDIVAFARGVCNSFVNLSDRKNINLTFYSDSDSIDLMFDEDKMEKIFMNLLGNAFKFTPAGGRIDVALEHVGEENPMLRIKISDTGIGIKDKDKEHIFDRFYQVDDQGESHPGMGSGIGLSMVSEYVKLHEGRIRVTDNVEQGSVFIIDIPIKRSEVSKETKTVNPPDLGIDEGHTVQEPEVEAELTGQEREHPIALVVDDNPDMTEMLKDSLENEFEVITASDGNEALKMVKDVKPAIILTDLMMPGMNGIELCRRLKSDPDTVSVPLIIITAKHDLGVKLEGLTLGADDYITKPFNLDVLRLRMRRLVALTAKGARRSLIEPEPEQIEITPLDERFIERAMKYVSDNLDRSDLSVEELSSTLGMSRVRLYKKIKQITGKTPIEFIRVIRLKRAAQMLRESQLNVSEIAYQTGFNNPKVFSKYFKEEFGILPSAYQNKEGKDTNYTV